MAISQFTVAFPRFRINTAEISEIWGRHALLGYSQIRVLGSDEDATTLAVEAFNQLAGSSETVLVYGPVNQSVFIEACGIDENRVVRFYNGDDVDGISILKEIIETDNSAGVLVATPKSTDPRLSPILGAAAVAFKYGKTGLSLLDMMETTGSNENQPRGLHSNLQISADAQRIKKQDELYEDTTFPKIYSTCNLNLLRKIKSEIKYDQQKTTGYLGIVSIVLELINWLENCGLEAVISIHASDPSKTMALKVSKSAEIKIKYFDNSNRMNYHKLLQKGTLGTNPGEIAQGAFISQDIYQSNSPARYRLQAAQCTECASVEFPPRRRCKQCGGITKLGPEIGKKGKLYSFTRILRGAAPTEFDNQQLIDGEYGVGIIEFEEGPHTITQITDVDIDELEIGDPMRMVFRLIYVQDEQPRYGYKFTKIQSK